MNSDLKFYSASVPQVTSFAVMAKRFLGEAENAPVACNH